MRREAVALAVAAFVALVLVAPQVRAGAMTLQLSACETLALGSFESYRIAGGIEHYRNWQWSSTFVGTFSDGTPLSGTGGGLLNWDLNAATGDGDLFGEFHWTFAGFQGGVTFSGRFSGTFDAGVIHDSWVAHAGTMTIMGKGLSGACPGGASLQDAVILIP